MDDKSKIIVAALAGAVVGAGVSLLLAPASGKDTRGVIVQKFGEASEATKGALENAKDSVIDKGEELLKKANLKS